MELSFVDEIVTAAWRNLDTALAQFDGSEEAYERIDNARARFPNREPDGEAVWSLDFEDNGYSSYLQGLETFLVG